MSQNEDSLPDLEMPFDDGAKVMLDKAKLPIGNPEKEFDEGNIDVAQEKRRKALETYRDDATNALLLISDCIEMYPNSPMYLNTRAEIFAFHGDISLAIRDLRIAEQRAGEVAPFKTYKMLGTLLFENRDFSEAIKYLQKALGQENDETLQAMLKEAHERAQEDQKRQSEFEMKQAKKPEQAAKEQEKGINADIQDEIRRKYGDNPVYESPLFKNLFSTAQNMTDSRAEELMHNDVLMSCLNDPEFARKIAEVAQNPQAGMKYSNDPQFMKAFQQVLGAFK